MGETKVETGGLLEQIIIYKLTKKTWKIANWENKITNECCSADLRLSYQHNLLSTTGT